MKKISLTFLFIALFIGNMLASTPKWVGISGASPSKPVVTLVSGTDSHSVIEVSLNGFFSESVATPKGEATVISVPGAPMMLEKGNPELPYVTTSLMIPDRANMVVKVLSSEYTDYENILVAPSKGSFTRDILPSSVPYVYGEQYQKNEFYPASQAEMQDPFIFRDVRGQGLILQPFVYNAVTKTLRVYHKMRVEVKADGVNNTNAKVAGNTRRIDAEFMHMYKDLFINYNNNFAKYNPFVEHGKMLIISHPQFIDAMAPFVEWKNSIGIETKLVSLSEVGTTASQIQQYVKTYYETNNNAFLLFVGDSQHIPPMNGSYGASDVKYAYITGNDRYPEFLVGRFSVETVAHVQTMVTRTIEYEKNPNTETDWFSKGIGIASQEGPGDNGEYDYQHIRNIRTKLMNFTYTGVSELYEGSQGGVDAAGHPTAALVSNDVNSGATIINYCGHGSNASWVTSGFSNTNVNSLSNNHKWPFIWSVACVNGAFVGITCFAEAWTRAANANGPTGALATLMATINQAWYQPMAAQDEMNAVLTESYENNIKRTFGGLSNSGIMKMLEKYPSGAGPETAETWVVFGDPSVMVRTAMPTQLQATHPNTVTSGQAFVVSSSVNGARATLSRGNEMLATGVVENGSVSLNVGNLGTSTSPITLTVVGFNHIPYIKTLTGEGGDDLAPVTNLTSSVAGNNVTLNWNKPSQGGEGDVTVILQTTDVWGDGSGYQLLLDADAVEFGQTIPVSGAIWNDCNAPATLYDVFEYKAPENADPVCTTLNMVCNNQVSITIPAGTYDYCIVNPTPNSKLWIAAGENGRKDDYVFESGKVYHFLVEFGGFNDMTTITVSDRATGEVLEVVKSVNNNVDENVRSGKGNVTNTVYTAAPAQTRALKGYKIYRDGTQIAEINNPETLTYTDNGVANGSHNYCVEAVYDEGAAPKVCIDVTVGNGQDCNPATNVQAVANNSTVNVTWNAPAAKEVVSFNFDAGDLAGWTNIDADGDGNVWVSSATPGIYHNPGVDLTGNGHNGSAHFVISGSYANQGGVLTPDNYFVAPQKYAMGEGSSISFWVCAQDANYPAEHFGVAVSTTGNTNAADFTTIKEWTLTANGNKSVNANATREGNGKVAGVWYQVSCDLSAYAGQEIWIAIRHFNVSDQFIINLDDVEITTSGGNVSDDYTYTLTRNGEVIKTGLTVTSYADNNVPNGTYSYCVKVVYSDCTSASACAANVVVNSTGIDAEEDVAGLRVYPNPATEILNVEGNNIKDIVLYNSLGQTVKVGAINGQINVSNLSNGVYYLVVVSNDGKRAVEKIVIAK